MKFCLIGRFLHVAWPQTHTNVYFWHLVIFSSDSECHTAYDTKCPCWVLAEYHLISSQTEHFWDHSGQTSHVLRQCQRPAATSFVSILHSKNILQKKNQTHKHSSVPKWEQSSMWKKKKPSKSLQLQSHLHQLEARKITGTHEGEEFHTWKTDYRFLGSATTQKNSCIKSLWLKRELQIWENCLQISGGWRLQVWKWRKGVGTMWCEQTSVVCLSFYIASETGLTLLWERLCPLSTWLQWVIVLL